MTKTKNKSSALDKTFSGGASDKVRSELVEMLYNSLTNNVNKVSGQEFLSKVEMCGNVLHDLAGFANSLNDAVVAILENYPNEGETSCDTELQSILEMCGALRNGVEITTQYIDGMKTFGNDLDTIKGGLNNSLVGIHGEIV